MLLGAGAAALGVLGPDTAEASDKATSPQQAFGFNQGWLFGGRYTAGAELPGHADSHYARVTVPHTVTELSWADWDYTHWQQRWIYRKHFSTAILTPGRRRVLLTFDGVMTNATVLLNGKTVATHQGGYLPFTAELTEHLNVFGDNVLAVICDGRWLDVPPDALPAGASTIDYLQPAGIYRDVRLDVVPRSYLADVFARPRNVLTADRSVRVTATVRAGAVPKGQTATLTATLLDSAGSQLASAKAAVKIASTGAHAASVTIGKLPAVSYWSPENPALYTVRTTLSYAGTALAEGGSHTVSTRIGFREAVFKTDGFYLNGSRYQIFGLNRHQLYPYLGMAAPASVQRRDARILKEVLNVNMVRCSHYPQSPHFLDACDELGIMVFEEPPGWSYIGDATFQQLVLDNVRDMVIRDRNRPSVVVWGTRLDETKNYITLYAKARQLAYTYDGSRQTSGALAFMSTAGWAEDVFSHDDYHIVGGIPQLRPPVAGYPYLVTEAIGAGINPTYRWADPTATLADQALWHAMVHDQARANPRYTGLLGWAGFDYYSGPPADAAALLKDWRTMRTPGVVDVFRVPKPGASIYQSQVDPGTRPVLIPVFCWDVTDPPGATAMFATNCDRIELYLGGRHWQTATPDITRFGHLRYPPVTADLTFAGRHGGLPDLRVEGYLNGALVKTLLMTADTSRDRLELTVGSTQIVGDGSDATGISFRAVDAYGNRRPGVTGDVTLTLSGPGTLVGTNPFPFGTLGGVGGAFVRSLPGAAGQVTVTATHATLGSATTRITVVRLPLAAHDTVLNDRVPFPPENDQ
jgi:beta-galactosidase